MNFLELSKKRYSVRGYQDRSVEDNKLNNEGQNGGQKAECMSHSAFWYLVLVYLCSASVAASTMKIPPTTTRAML